MSTTKKNILFIIPWMEIGGADKFNLCLAAGLKNKDWSIHIVCTSKSSHPWKAEFEAISKNIWLLSDSASIEIMALRIQNIIIANSIDIIFLSNSMQGYQLLPWLTSNLPNIPVVDYLHCEDIDWHNGGYPMVSATFHEFIDHTVTTSGQLQQWLIERGTDRSNTSVCYINIDTIANRKNIDRNLTVRKLLGISKDITMILFVARLTPQKQPLVLLESIEQLYQVNKSFKCIIIGDGPEKTTLLSQINKSKAKQAIHFLGSLPNEEVMDYMDAADIFFLPSAYEGIALSIFEAMAKELAIVGADVGGQKELVTPDCGYLIPRSSPKQEAGMYANILSKLISEPNKIKELGKNSRRRVEEHFPLEQMINKMDMILQEAIKNHKSLAANVADQYLILLNRLLHLESVNQQLSEVSNNKINKLLLKYQRQYNLARKSYHKLRGIIVK